MTVAEYANDYVAHGWAVVPLVPRGKRPATSVPHGKDEATTDRAIVSRWFTRPDENIGIHAGRSGFVVVDIDLRNNGFPQFAALVDEVGELPVCPTADTGGGGVHYLLRAPVFDELRFDLRAKLRVGVDVIRGHNYIVAPPSIHPSGGQYLWRHGRSPNDVALPEIPPAWLALILRPRPLPEQRSITSTHDYAGESVFDVLAQLDQKYVLECLSGTLIVNGEVFTFKRNANGRYNLIVDGKERGNFIDAQGRIGAPDTGRKDGGPLASTWLRWYGHDDKTIRAALIASVPELTRFAERSPSNGVSRAPHPAELADSDDEWHPEETQPPTEDEYADVDAFADRDREKPSSPTPKTPARPPWFRAAELVDEIWRRRNEPWISIMLGHEELCRLPAGGLGVVMGGSGSGKSSIVANSLIWHAANAGPAIALSIELPAHELAARIAGIKCDASWEDVLRGRVQYEFLRQALSLERLYVLERRNATLAQLVRCIRAAKLAFPGQPILVGLDYVQLVASKEREIRLRVADALEQIDEVARAEGVVILVVSQMSRAGANAAVSGERLGAETASLGAESAAIERFASITISIGRKGEPRGDGSCAVEISIGKGRMSSAGDSVLPARCWGRSGLWRLEGEAKAAAQVRSERDAVQEAANEASLENQLIGAATKSEVPLTREQLLDLVHVRVRRQVKLAAITRLIASGDLVEVAQHAVRNKTWLLWTLNRARNAGIKLASEASEGDS